MHNNIESIIKYDCESQVLDFKLKPYMLGNHPKRHELLKDICAFANNPSSQDKYIIIGVKEEQGRAVDFESVQNEFDEASYQQYIFENIEPQISFEYKSIKYQEYNLSYFRIYNNKLRPYLFKKEIKESIKQKLIYNIGAGVIRRGTTTECLNREDFEQIYKLRYESRDRKSDLEVTLYTGKSEEDVVSDYNLDFIDVRIENKSAKSIGFDIELRINKVNGLTIQTLFEAKKGLRNLSHDVNNIITGQTSRAIYYPEINPFNISIKSTDKYYSVENVLLRDQTNTVILSQRSKDDSIFCKEVIVIAEDTSEINGEVILKSDSFTEGPLIKEFSLSIEKNI